MVKRIDVLSEEVTLSKLHCLLLKKGNFAHSSLLRIDPLSEGDQCVRNKQDDVEVVSHISSPEHEFLKMSYYDRSVSVVHRALLVARRPSCIVHRAGQKTTPPTLLGQMTRNS